MTPSFLLSGPAGTLVGTGTKNSYDDVADASRALRDGSAAIVVGALPFDIRDRAALMEPARIGDSVAPRTAAAPSGVRITGRLPDPQTHRARITAALELLRDAENPLEKVVLARALHVEADEPMDPMAILHRLIEADPAATAYLADLSPAGLPGAILIGASPELLVARFGDEVFCQPFAGSAPRSADPHTDQTSAQSLATSGKNRHEHQLVVDTMRIALEPLCAELDIASEPQLSSTAAVWHLSTPIRGRLRESSTTALDLALALHPTPAVGGVPTAAAVDVIADLEGGRGFYAGAVGWCDARGDGRWVVAIRGAQLSADRLSAVAQAGGGIVSESDPDDEVAETTTKFRTILTALGVAE